MGVERERGREGGREEREWIEKGWRGVCVHEEESGHPRCPCSPAHVVYPVPLPVRLGAFLCYAWFNLPRLS